MRGFFYFGKDNGQVVCYPWKVEVAGSNPVFPTKIVSCETTNVDIIS